MDKKYLDKVIDQLVSETTIDYDEEEVFVPFHPFYFLSLFYSPNLDVLSLLYFSNHCRDVYGLNEQEIKYVWKEYKRIIKDKINNG
tara:strand:+ start:1330 stop:1587 length:258 start_codon:yes stop_codon:yes gene_type:complete